MHRLLLNNQFRLQLWRMRAKQAWLFAWNTKPSDLLLQAFFGTLTIGIFLQLLVWLAPLLWSLALGWGVFLLVLALARAVALRFR